jgi:tetratricopeptide (TPR) repeat protein
LFHSVARRILTGVNTPLKMLRRWVCVLLLLAMALCAGFSAFQNSTWHQKRLLGKLLSGKPEQQLMAASELVYLGAQDRLIEALQSENESARGIAQRALEHLWFTASGNDAYQSMQKAYRLQENNQSQEALVVLQEVIAKYPRFAEAYNQRASVYWEMGEIAKSMADSRYALTLNPAHYGAWQGLAMAYRQQGNFSAAARCLRMAMHLIPHDVDTREALRKCEETLKRHPCPSTKDEFMEMT